MKKAVNYACVFFILISCIMFFMSCDDDIGLGDTPQNTPENPFTNTEWEQIYKNHLGEAYQGNKITFTANGFTLNEWSNNNTFNIHFDRTFAGSYSISADNVSPDIIMTLTSDEPKLNGQVLCLFDNPDTVLFHNFLSNPSLEFGGTYTRVVN